jgi:hypothetical protein
MSGLILPASYETRSVIGRGEDVNDIARSVQDGDMTIGWRGDPQMDVYRKGSEIQVLGFDAKGTRYVAATVNLADPDWRTTLLRKLRDGDWQRDDFFSNLETARAEKEADDRRRQNEMFAEMADQYTSQVWKNRGSKRMY